jgi:hypothetical protein
VVDFERSVSQQWNGCSMGDRDSRTWRGDFESPSATPKGPGQVIVGRPARYRLGFTSMSVIGLPDQMRVGDVLIRSVDGPVRTQQTTVVQRPGLQPTFEKWMEHPLVGTGQHLTIAELVVTISEPLTDAMREWRAKALAAVGYAAALLDERIAQDEVLEDVTVLNDDGSQLAQVDIKLGVRTFEPSHPWFEEYERDLNRYATAGTPRLRTACRWYLQAVRAGPSAESIVMFWVTLESLVPALGGAKSRNDVRDVEDAIRRAEPGLDPKTDVQPTLGHMAGLRARIVHQGAEADPLIPDAFYTLEALCRLLLRHEFGAEGGWPYFPAEPMLRPPLSDIPRPPRTIWRENPHMPREDPQVR